MSKSPKKSPKAAKERGLGRGLSALMSDISPALAEGDVPRAMKTKPASKPTSKAKSKSTKSKPKATKPNAASGTQVRVVPLHLVTRNPAQPRLRFDKDRLAELASSLKQRGVLQPILVRPLPASQRPKGDVRSDYQIVAGERRYQAAMQAGITDVPVIIRDLSDRDVLEIGVIENVQRANLNPMEEARAYATLADEFDRKHAEIATAIGKSRAYVSNAIRLTGLPAVAQDYVLDGKISAGHARAILSADNPRQLTDLIVARGLSVREAERLAKSPAAQPKRRTTTRPEIAALQSRLEESLNVRAKLTEGRGESVTLKLAFPNEAAAMEAIERLTKG